jgi:hypothetical protein
MELKLLAKNAPAQAEELCRLIEKLRRDTERVDATLRRRFYGAEPFRSRVEHLKDLSRQAALLVARAERIETTLRLLSTWPPWIVGECRNELEHLIQGWLKRCGRYAQPFLVAPNCCERTTSCQTSRSALIT